jgi:carbonic anhydrase
MSGLRTNEELAQAQILVNRIVRGLSELHDHVSAQQQLARAVEANLRWSMKRLLDTLEGNNAAREGQKKLVGAVFEIGSGRVRFLKESI